MFTFEHDGKTYSVQFDYRPHVRVAEDKLHGYVHNHTMYLGRFGVRAQMYEHVGTLTLPHPKWGTVTVPEKSIRGEQTYVVSRNDHKCSRRQARERALSALLKRKGFDRVARLAVFAKYQGKIHNDRMRKILVRLGAVPERVPVQMTA